MSNLTQTETLDGAIPEPARTDDTRPVPRITIQAFCDTPEVAGTIEMAAGDRRMWPLKKSKIAGRLSQATVTWSPPAISKYS